MVVKSSLYAVVYQLLFAKTKKKKSHTIMGAAVRYVCVLVFRTDGTDGISKIAV